MDDGNNCRKSEILHSWIDLQRMMPKNILELIANAKLNTTSGVFSSSTNFGNATWSANPFTIGGVPMCIALGSDNQQLVADADQWNFQHLTAKTDSSIAIPLRKLIFLRGGIEWSNRIPIDFGGSSYTDLQLSFRDNAATRGDAQGTWPVIQFTGSFTGLCTLEVVLRKIARVSIGLRAVTGSTTSMFEMEWAIEP